ncbi:MAG: 2'-5' RNA ligase family protein [Bacteroidetes bacterium]|nr:2'-5' RNA ligase family protein [Bacteroidota bacterium]
MDEVYAAVIVPTNEIVETVKIFKQGLESVVGKFPAANADPAIILFAAMADETRAALLEKKLVTICRNQLPFTVQLDNFGEFYNNKTVFVDIDESSKQTITAFRKKLSAEIKLSKYDELVDFNVGKTPHITIARGLVEDQYKVARKYFTGRNYTAAFECNCLVWKKLIKTSTSAYYTPIRTFEFANKNLSLF